MAGAIEELLARGFCARNYAHELHIQTRSFAAHDALGDFYEAIVPALDRLAECCQGRFGVLSRFPDVKPDRGRTIREWLKNEAQWINAHMPEITGQDPTIENLLQEVIAIYYQTIDRLGRS